MNRDAPDGVKRQALGDLTNIHRKRALPSSPGKTTMENKLGKLGRTLENEPNKSIPLCLGSVISNGVKDGKTLLSSRCHPLEEGNLGVLGPVGTELSTSRSLDPAFPFGEKTQEDDSGEETEEDIPEDSDTNSTEFMVQSSQSRGACSHCLAFNQGNANSFCSKENDCDGMADSSQNGSCTGSCSKAARTSLNVAGLEGFLEAYDASNKVPNAAVENTISMGKGCSCSFCLKAAYIWTNLQYHDGKDCLAVLKKSRTFARTVEGRFYNNGYDKRVAQDNSTRTSKMEFDLLRHCRSLFLRTETFLVHERDQLNSNLRMLEELRESCKGNLESINMASKKRS